MAGADLCIVLHAHLPFVRHPEHEFHLEEQWLYEAVLATYLPILEMLQRLDRDHVPGRITLSMSPTLATMLDDPMLRKRTRAYLATRVALAERELARTTGDGHLQYLGRFYHDRFTRLLALWDQHDGALPAAFGAHHQRGRIELITVGATHGYLPIIASPEARRAQIAVAVADHSRRFGQPPRGIWLPECGYTDGIDRVLVDHGIQFCIVDSHAVLNARPRPPHRLYSPILTSAGLLVFPRDVESSKQVWSAQEGYPGDGLYRDFYRDIGFDLPLAEVADFVHPDGIRVHTGIKYHRVTGGDIALGDKALYDPWQAEQRASMHAGNFAFNRQHQVRHLRGQMGTRPCIVAPYDAELFGHWWFEGPWFLEALLRKLAFDHALGDDAIRAATPLDHVASEPVQAVCDPSPASWGDGGYSTVWIDDKNDWIYRHTHRAERQMQRLVQRAGVSDLHGRACKQAARELLLAQASDWAFIMKTGTTVEYAVLRVKTHLARFRKLADGIEGITPIDPEWLTATEQRSPIFAELDISPYR